MIRQRLGRFATIFTTAAMAAALLGVGTVSAANPSWDILFESTPKIVAAGNGNDAGFIVTVVNNGPSQINNLSVTLTATDNPTTPSFLSSFVYAIPGNPAPTCTNTAPIRCELGTFVDDQSVTFTVAYPVLAGTTGTFDLDIAIRSGSGDTPSDGGGNSRGDARTETAKTPISSSANFDGGFVIGADDYATGGDLRRQNPQNTALVPPEALIPVTIEEGVTDVTCNAASDPECAGVFGQWSRLNVNNGGNYTGDAFKVTLFVWGGSVPGGVQAEDIQVVHVPDVGAPYAISQICTFTGNPPVATNPECIFPTKVGNNYRIEVWLNQNGAIRGGI